MNRAPDPHERPKNGDGRPVIFKRTVSVPWDDLDEQGCAEDGAPDWTTLIVTGPTRRRGPRGHVSLEWTVTAQCRPAVSTPLEAVPSDRRNS
jgi:hypothetical protein